MKKKKKETDVQQLVIPRGMLGPGEVAVIEIPKRYHKAPVVVVKKKQGEIASSRAQNFFITTPYDESDVSRRGSRGIQDTTNSLQVPLPQMTQTCPGQFPGVSNPHQSISGQPRTPNNPVALNMTLPQVNQALSMLGFPNVANLATMMQPQQPMHPQQPQVGSCCGSNLHPPMPPRASCSPPLPWNSQCSGHVDLAYKERMEQEMFSTSLDEFQRARRKFLTSAKALSQKLSKISNSSTESY